MRPRARVWLVFFAVLLGSAGCDHAAKQIAIATRRSLPLGRGQAA